MRYHDDQMPKPLTSLSEHQNQRHTTQQSVRRKPTAEQNRALEILAHATEYLIDEGLLCGDTINLNVTEAVQLLSQASRSAYLACAEATGTGLTRRGSEPHIRWKWMPAAPFMVPLFRDPTASSKLQGSERA